LIRQFPGHQEYPDGLFLPDGDRFVSCDQGGTLRLWEVVTGRLLRRHEGRGHGRPPLSADGRFFAAPGEGQTVRLWATATGKEAATFPVRKGQEDFLTLSPRGNRVAVLDAAWTTLHLGEASAAKGHRIPTRDRIYPYSLLFSPCGKTLAGS